MIAVEAIGGASHVSPRVPGEAPGAGAARDPLSRPARPFCRGSTSTASPVAQFFSIWAQGDLEVARRVVSSEKG